MPKQNRERTGGPGQRTSVGLGWRVRVGGGRAGVRVAAEHPLNKLLFTAISSAAIDLHN